MPDTGNKANILTSAGPKVEVEGASTAVVAENLAREGLELVNASTASIYLELGGAAVLKQGIFLASGGGSWNGMVGPMVWTGSVNAIATAANSVLTVREV